jgi:hypothetical protein
VRLFVTHSLKHARVLMVQKVAMKSPPSRIVGIECRFRRHQDRVAHGAGKAMAVDRNNSSGVIIEVSQKSYAKKNFLAA